MAHRTQITLADEQYQRLRAESRRSGLGLAELVRRAIDHTYGSIAPAETIQALDASFGTWTDHPDDGAQYVEGVRPGMAHRLTSR